MLYNTKVSNGYDLTISLIKNRLNSYSQFPSFHYDMKQQFDEEEMKFMCSQEQTFFRYRNIQRKHELEKDNYKIDSNKLKFNIRQLTENTGGNSPLPSRFIEMIGETQSKLKHKKSSDKPVKPRRSPSKLRSNIFSK